jgi:hypothetical protein
MNVESILRAVRAASIASAREPATSGQIRAVVVHGRRADVREEWGIANTPFAWFPKENK